MTRNPDTESWRHFEKNIIYWKNELVFVEDLRFSSGDGLAPPNPIELFGLDLSLTLGALGAFGDWPCGFVWVIPRDECDLIPNSSICNFSFSTLSYASYFIVRSFSNRSVTDRTIAECRLSLFSWIFRLSSIWFCSSESAFSCWSSFSWAYER